LFAAKAAPTTKTITLCVLCASAVNKFFPLRASQSITTNVTQHKSFDMKNNETPQLPPPGAQFYTGAALLLTGFLLPLLVPLVACLDISTEARALISGVLLVGGPEVFSLIAIAIMGKPGFIYIKAKVFAMFKRVLPTGEVSRLRYNIGLALLIPHVFFAYIIFYAPQWLPGYDEHRVAMNLTADCLLVITLFILGEDFWDKLRALFIYDAKAGIPRKS